MKTNKCIGQENSVDMREGAVKKDVDLYIKTTVAEGYMIRLQMFFDQSTKVTLISDLSRWSPRCSY